MTAIDPAVTLGDLVTAHPELARELERRRLDYCCGGASTLAEAVAAQDLDLDRVVAELQGAAGEPVVPDWATLDAPALVEHVLATHHAYLDAELPRLSALAAKVRAVHGERHPELGAVVECFETIRSEMEPHLRTEETEFFPLVHRLASGDARVGEVAAGGDATQGPGEDGDRLRAVVARLHAEHDVVGDLLARLRALTGDYSPPADGCASYTALYAGFEALEADTHAHVHKENNRLFPLALALDAPAPHR